MNSLLPGQNLVAYTLVHCGSTQKYIRSSFNCSSVSLYSPENELRRALAKDLNNTRAQSALCYQGESLCSYIFTTIDN